VSGAEKKRQLAISELMTTEETYVNDMVTASEVSLQVKVRSSSVSCLQTNCVYMSMLLPQVYKHWICLGLVNMVTVYATVSSEIIRVKMGLYFA